MRIIQINEDEKNNEQYEQDTMNQLRNSFNYVVREQSDIENDRSVINTGETYNLQVIFFLLP